MLNAGSPDLVPLLSVCAWMASWPVTLALGVEVRVRCPLKARWVALAGMVVACG